MKKCQIIIKRKDHHTVSFIFDDLRIAQAIINILDNVAEVRNEGDHYPELKHIKKDIVEGK